MIIRKSGYFIEVPNDAICWLWVVKISLESKGLKLSLSFMILAPVGAVSFPRVLADKLEPAVVTSFLHRICGLGCPPARQLTKTLLLRTAEVDLGGSMKKGATLRV